MSVLKRRLLLYLLAAAVLALLTVTALNFSDRINRIIRQENYGFLEDVAKQSAATVNKKLEGDMRMLQGMAVLLGDEPELDVAHWVSAFDSQTLFQQFQRIGILLPNGLGYGQDVSGTDFSDRDYFQKAMKGQSVVSDMLVDRVTGVASITYAVPIVHQEQIIGVLGAVTNSDVFQRELFEKPFMGHGYACLIDNKGTVILSSDNAQEQLKTTVGLFDQISAPDDAAQTMRGNLRNGHPGQMEYELNGQPQILCYVPLGVNGWYMASALPLSVVQEKSHGILLVTTLSVGAVALVLLAFLASLVLMRRRNGKKLYRMAYYDEMTGLLNKNGFRMEAGNLCGKQAYVYGVFDVKRFRAVNERFGYSCGDDLLRHVASVLRDDCGPQERVSRFSGDLFHLLWCYHDDAEIEARFQKVAQLADSFPFPGDPDVRLQFGMGAYVVEGGVAPDAMGDMAKLALETIRSHHATGLAFYTNELQSSALLEQAIERDMNSALKNREFQVFLQPKYTLETGTIASAEALVRWNHPQRGMISPAQFIPLFEKNGFIADLDLYMFRSVCLLLRRWIGKGWDPVPVAINQSRLSLFTEGHLDKLVDALACYNVPARLLAIEITESAFWGDNRQIIDVVSRLHQLGFLVSMDDFGSGYSSLNMLKDIPIDELKLDKNFFDFSANRQRGRLIVRNIVSMAQDLRISVVAEGVETAEHVHLLRQTGCQLVQGYYYSKPVPCDTFERLAFE